MSDSIAALRQEAVTRRKLPLWIVRSPVIRYGLGVVSFALALGLALLAQHYDSGNVELPLFLFAISVTAWYAGPGPAALTVALSIVSFDFFFVEPRYTFFVTASDLPYMTMFVAFAVLVAWFSSVRRAVERDLLDARDHLRNEVAERTQQASLLNLTHDTIFVRDMTKRITFWNRGAQELYGWTAQEAVGTRSHELLKTVFPMPEADITAELLRTSRWEGELTRTKSNGTEVTVSSRWALRRDEQNRPVAVLETNNDVTERRRREAEVNRLNQELARRSLELESSNKELEAFAYSVSHDLRAPLRHVAGYTELLQKRISSTLDEKSTRYVQMLLESAKQMGNLIDDLLSFSRIGRAETRKTLVSMDQLAKEALAEVQRETEGRKITWKIGALPNLYGDRSMFRVVLVNLLSNAVKFTGTRAQAEIEIAAAGGNDNETIVFVRDNGVGFDMKYVHKLFGVFQRLHQSSAFEGTGIGLATVQRVIHRHGGRVWAEGAVDKGATFYFSTPKSYQA